MLPKKNLQTIYIQENNFKILQTYVRTQKNLGQKKLSV